MAHRRRSSILPRLIHDLQPPRPPASACMRRRLQQPRSPRPQRPPRPLRLRPRGFLTPGGALRYTIEFSNEKTAQVPADNVVVTEQLSPNLDWSTFQLGTIGFGSYVVNVPPGLTSYSTRVDATATLGVYVDIDASLNLSTGLLTVTFTSLDPTTLDTPSNPLVGFLPPDTNPPNGEGYINFTIQPKAGLATGATLNAQASIVFDTNAPIATPQITNTIDASPPTSAVAALPATTTTPELHGLLVRLRRRRPGHRRLQRLRLRRRRCVSRSGSRTPRRRRRPTPARSATPTPSTAWRPTTSASSSRRRPPPRPRPGINPRHRHPRPRQPDAHTDADAHTDSDAHADTDSHTDSDSDTDAFPARHRPERALGRLSSWARRRPKRSWS